MIYFYIFYISAMAQLSYGICSDEWKQLLDEFYNCKTLTMKDVEVAKKDPSKYAEAKKLRIQDALNRSGKKASRDGFFEYLGDVDSLGDPVSEGLKTLKDYCGDQLEAFKCGARAICSPNKDLQLEELKERHLCGDSGFATQFLTYLETPGYTKDRTDKESSVVDRVLTDICGDVFSEDERFRRGSPSGVINCAYLLIPKDPNLGVVAGKEVSSDDDECLAEAEKRLEELRR